jgi:Predicted membrane protein
MKTKQDNFLVRFIKGMIIALGFILPGVSGGVLAAILGIYERMLSFMAHIRKNFKRDFVYFLPVGIGGIVGIGVLSKPLEYLLANYQMIVLWGFAGTIIGTLPTLVFESTSRTKRDRIDVAWFFSVLIGGGLFLFFMNELLGTIPANFLGFVIAGILIALGVLVPGLSPSNLLIILGLYTPMLKGFKDFDLMVFIPIAIGGIISMLTFSKAMEKLIQHHHSRVYHFILGIVLASTILILVPNPYSSESITYQNATMLDWSLSIIFFFVGIVLAFWMSKLEDRYK